MPILEKSGVETLDDVRYSVQTDPAAKAGLLTRTSKAVPVPIHPNKQN